MEQTTTGIFRVLASTRDSAEWLLLDVENGDPTYVPAAGYDGELADAVAALEPGNRVRATLAWDDGTPRFADLVVETDTRVQFVRTTQPLFEAAKRCWNEAVETGAAMNSRVTRGTDGEPNGVVYVFAAQPGRRDLFEEFRDGVKPLEPLLDRALEGAEPPLETFVLEHPEHPFVTVYVVLDPDGFLAETVRDTFLDGDEDSVGGGDGEDGGSGAGEGGGLADRL